MIVFCSELQAFLNGLVSMRVGELHIKRILPAIASSRNKLEQNTTAPSRGRPITKHLTILEWSEVTRQTWTHSYSYVGGQVSTRASV